jgi:Fur family peroxide stress response transcriptional regulator
MLVEITIIGRVNMLKYSKQREYIKEFLANRQDHPTAETIYSGVKDKIPQISLGTVYRNLSLMSNRGEIIKISTDSGPDRFDGNCSLHYHFFCISCGCILDLDMESIEHINTIAEHHFDGQILGSTTKFFGNCPTCLEKQ